MSVEFYEEILSLWWVNGSSFHSEALRDWLAKVRRDKVRQ